MKLLKNIDIKKVSGGFQKCVSFEYYHDNEIMTVHECSGLSSVPSDLNSLTNSTLCNIFTLTQEDPMFDVYAAYLGDPQGAYSAGASICR